MQEKRQTDPIEKKILKKSGDIEKQSSGENDSFQMENIEPTKYYTKREFGDVCYPSISQLH
jgi:hypothetical protein